MEGDRGWRETEDGGRQRMKGEGSKKEGGENEG